MTEGGYSDDDRGSSPCFLHELGADGSPQDSQQAVDVARWRKVERERLIAARLALTAQYRAEQTQLITHALDHHIPDATDTIVGAYWPIRGEPDLRQWMRVRWHEGLRIALPVATALGEPLQFREWRPDAPMQQGLWKIPFPAEGPVVQPTVILAPVVGFDPARYRLGYGGGFFDRTLQRMTPPPLKFGIGYCVAEIPTIYPQPHDVPMDRIVTGER